MVATDESDLLDDPLFQASELRASGLSWDAAAQKLDMDEGELRLALVDYVTLDESCDRGVLLLVDEGHHLSLRLLDEIRAMTNLMRQHQPAIRSLAVPAAVD